MRRSLLAPFAVLVACNPDPLVKELPSGPTGPADAVTLEPARFADASDNDLWLAYFSGIGLTGGVAVLDLAFAAVPDALEAEDVGSPCPTMTVGEQDVVFDAGEGCDAPSGASYAGTATINAAALDLFADDPHPIDLEAVGFAVDLRADGGALDVFDGTFYQDAQTGSFSADIDMTFTRVDDMVDGGLGATGHVDCVDADDIERCDLQGTGWVDGLGAFSIALDQDTLDLGGNPTLQGTLVLVGEDTLTFDLGEQTEEPPCIAYDVDGVEGWLCM